MDKNEAPKATEAQIRMALLDWTDEEFHQLIGYYHRNINADGTTNLTLETWKRLAEEF